MSRDIKKEFDNLNDEDKRYLSDINAALTYGAPVRFHILAILVFIFLIIAYFWADSAMLDEVTRGSGKVIPSKQIQTVQNLEGGILTDIYVTEGQLVEEGQELMRLDDIQFSSTLKENQLKYYELLANQSRLLAEVEGKELVMPEEIKENYPALAQRTQELYYTRVAQHEATLRVLEQKVNQKNQAILEQRSKIRQLSSSLQLVQEEIALSEPLVGTGAISEVEILRLKRTENDLSGELETIRQSIPRLESELQEAKDMIAETQNKYQSKVLSEYNDVKADLDQIGATLVSMQDRVSRTQIVSPVRGTVKQIKINTLGGVVRPGMDLIDIVPAEDRLLVEAQVRPSDIAFLRPGQNAMVKFTAYDFSIYGGLEANLVHISADTIYDPEKEQEFFVIRLRTKKNYIEHKGETLDIIPGMIVNVDILTGEKSVLDYLLKPILKARDTALRER